MPEREKKPKRSAVEEWTGRPWDSDTGIDAGIGVPDDFELTTASGKLSGEELKRRHEEGKRRGEEWLRERGIKLPSEE